VFVVILEEGDLLETYSCVVVFVGGTVIAGGDIVCLRQKRI
jgi:hypothetical protein